MALRLLPVIVSVSQQLVTHSLPRSGRVVKNPMNRRTLMEITPNPTPDRPSAHADRQAMMMQTARDLEATFLAEMLGHAGLGTASESFSGGAGEAQFASFLKQEQARLVVERGGIGLAEAIFNAMAKAEVQNAANN